MCMTHEVQGVLRVRIRVKFLFVKSVYIAILISISVSFRIDLTHLPMMEFLCCLGVVVEMPGM